ncbi:MAG: acetoacetate decarboxylase family protein [Chitinophagales bacterium]
MVWSDKPAFLPLHDPLIKREHLQEDFNGTSGVVWKGARMLSHVFTVSEETFKAFVPPELSPTDSRMAAVFVAEYPYSSLGAYKQAGLMFYCQFENTVGWHFVCNYDGAMDKDFTMGADRSFALGRELGFPKFMANIELFREGTQVIGTVRRQGIEIIRVWADLQNPGEAFPEQTFIQFKSHLTSDTKAYLYREIWAAKFTYHTHMIRFGTGEVRFPKSNDLIQNCVVEQPIMTFYRETDQCMEMPKTLKVLHK